MWFLASEFGNENPSSGSGSKIRVKAVAIYKGKAISPQYPMMYVGAEKVQDDGNPFAGKTATHTSELADQFADSAKLEKAIRKNIKALGFELPARGTK